MTLYSDVSSLTGQERKKKKKKRSSDAFRSEMDGISSIWPYTPDLREFFTERAELSNVFFFFFVSVKRR